MKAKCFNCGKEFDWEQEEDWQECTFCDGSGIDGIGNNCDFCNGEGFVDINADEVPICEDCLMKEEEEEF